MKIKKSFWAVLIGSIASALPFLVSCPGIACVSCGGACFIPVISVLGLSVTGIFASGWWLVLQPLFIVISAILFTIAYFSIFRKPKTFEHCGKETCSFKDTKINKSGRTMKIFFWICLVFSISVFTLSLLKNSYFKNVPVNKAENNINKQSSSFAFFDVDCLEWDQLSQSLKCKARVLPIASKVYDLHDYAAKNNIPVLFTSCCSGTMPTKKEMDSIGMAFIALDPKDYDWQNKVTGTQSFYIANRDTSSLKVNEKNNKLDVFKNNPNLSLLLDKMNVKNWIVFGNEFEKHTIQVIDGLLSRGYKVIVIEDMLSSSDKGNEDTREKILENYKKKGVKVQQWKFLKIQIQSPDFFLK